MFQKRNGANESEKKHKEASVKITQCFRALCFIYELKMGSIKLHAE